MKVISYSIMQRLEKQHWWFRVRHELIIQLFRKYFSRRTDLKILDIGCGMGSVSALLSRWGTVYSVDPSAEAIKFCRQKGLQHLYQNTAESLPFNDGFFDVVIALDVLEHVKDDQQAVDEISRVLKPQGVFICFVPAFMFLWSEQDEILMHYRRYNRSSLSSLFTDDWKYLKTSYFNFFLFPFIFSVRLLKKLLRLKQKKDEVEQISFLNPLFYWIFKREIFFLSRWRFPFGVSLLAVYKKN